jgi:hypothetical protein
MIPSMLGLNRKRWALDQIYTWWQLRTVIQAKCQKLRMYFQKRNRNCFVIYKFGEVHIWICFELIEVYYCRWMQTLMRT